MKKKLLILTTIIVAVIYVTRLSVDHQISAADYHFWDVEAVDTMKYSRDAAREKLTDPNFDAVIERQVSQIASTGASHVAIATPYDEEFLPILTRWVSAARRNNLKVWFRGNLSGWEEWFNYPSISREGHTTQIYDFITSNTELFEDGDVFTSCPECENGGPGDPRHTGDVVGFRQFLTQEYRTARSAFQKINKNVRANFYSMNGDVANLIMDPETTKALGGVVVVDHYVSTPEELVNDLLALAERSGGKVYLGEFGTPIPDINGNQTEEQQSAWITQAMEEMSKHPEIGGMNYWVSYGGSTQLWNNDGTPRQAVESLSQYFSPKVLEVVVAGRFSVPIAKARIAIGDRIYNSGKDGSFRVPVLPYDTEIVVSAEGYITESFGILDLESPAQVTIKRSSPESLINLFVDFASLLSHLRFAL